jgi:gamma-tubulin complex component 3
MSNTDKDRRITSAINNLVEHLVPAFAGEDPAEVDERRENAHDLTWSILQANIAPAVEADGSLTVIFGLCSFADPAIVNQAGDLIKKKLMRSSPTPEKAYQFNNLYQRLLAETVLTKKWAILYFLYQLADSDEPKPANGGSTNDRLAPPFLSPKKETHVLSDSFAAGGIQRLPTREQTDRKQSDQAFTKNVAAQQRERVALKTVLLSENSVEIDPPESTLLRDLPYTLQGISSTHMPFTSTTCLKLPATLPPPIISVLHTLAEPSLLYKGLTTFVRSSDGGLLDQSLRAAIQVELGSYLGVVSTLEGQIRRALSSLDESEPRGGIGKSGVTLRRCIVWTREPTMGLRLLSWIAEESKGRCSRSTGESQTNQQTGKKGGQLISLIHGLSSSHGDPLIGAFAERLLLPVTRPFYDMLRQWIYDGELSDPYHEFFVSEQDPNEVKPVSDGRSRGGASSVWEDKYKLDENMIPGIITQDFAQKVFLIGKSLNFIRYGCGDSMWVEQYSKAASKELKYGDTATLETWIDEAYKTTMARLIHLMADKFHLFEHLKALKNYILLGQGDFIALLMESLSAALDRPAGAQYRHTLTAQLEHAIRGSNAQYDSPEVLRRLDARMLQLSHGDIGWDCFTLEYKIDAPVDVVVTEWGNRQYLKVFNFLWRIKRVEFVLATTWRKCMTGARGVLQSVDPAVAQTWKSTRGVIAEMIHFIGQLQYYILFEVIESSWDELQTAIHKEGCTLDDLISSHTKYLNAITHKGLLGAKKSREEDESTFMSQLGELLRIILAYRDAVDGLYSWSVAEFTRRQEASVRAGTREFEGSDNEFTPTVADDSIMSLSERLGALGVEYRAKLSRLLGDLAYQPDVDMRFLGVVMNFNDVYQPVRKGRSKRV